MWDVATPIMIGEDHVGNLFSGQFFFADEPVDYELFRAQARLYGFNEEEYIAALDEVPRVSRQTLDDVMGFFMKLADMLSKLSYSNIKLARSLSERDELMDSLHRNRTLLSEAEKLSHTGAWEWDITNDIWTFSDEWLAIHGCTKNTLSPDELLLIAHPDDRIAVDRAFKDVRDGIKPYDIEHRIIRQDTSEVRVVRARGQYAQDSTGMVVRVYGFAQDITEQKQAEEEIRKLNAELEQRVAQRTAELEITNNELKAANKELEAFSYSVSHDLRAPLRAIDGFSSALLRNYLDSLDDRGQDYLQRVRAAAQRMGQLIDDILGLSRATRVEMHKQKVDLSAMAMEILNELRRSQPDRKVQINIEQGLVVDADAHLMRVALDNLLGNAWKFTSKRDTAVIEMGTFEQNGRRVYFIKDNGAGFNPAYADKLFSPFQRLHTESDFPGTGIGLALVHRILRRHGGNIWAESNEGQGAAFYFALGEADK
jgi:PAS domain S-box-containing protein